MNKKCMFLTIIIGFFILTINDVGYQHKTAQALYDAEKAVKIAEYKKCLKNSIFKEENFSNDLIGIKNQILSLYNTNANFKYEDLTDGYTFSKNRTASHYAASVNKLPLAVYAYHLADEGKLDLNEQKIYTHNYYRGGSGVIKNMSPGKTFTLGELLDKIILYSDNIAYAMMTEKIGLSNVKAYWQTKGYDIMYSDTFGNVSPEGMSIYAKEIYNYYLTGSKNAKRLVQNMEKSDNLDTIKNNGVKYQIAHKYGFYDVYYNDVAIIFDVNPYTVSITSTMGDTKAKDEFFLNSHRLLNDFNRQYWREKSNFCKKD